MVSHCRLPSALPQPGGSEGAYLGPGDFSNVKELVVPPRDDAVLVLSHLLRKQPTGTSRERARIPLVRVVGHLPARQHALLTLPYFLPWREHDRMRRGAKETAELLRLDGLGVDRELRESGRELSLPLAVLRGGCGGSHAAYGDLLVLGVEILSSSFFGLLFETKVLERVDEFGRGEGMGGGGGGGGHGGQEVLQESRSEEEEVRELDELSEASERCQSLVERAVLSWLTLLSFS